MPSVHGFTNYIEYQEGGAVEHAGYSSRAASVSCQGFIYTDGPCVRMLSANFREQDGPQSSTVRKESCEAQFPRQLGCLPSIHQELLRSPPTQARLTSS